MARGDGFFFHPSQRIYDDPHEHGLTFQSVFFEGEAGRRLHGWFFPAIGDAQGTIIHCHGNAGNITGHYRFVGWLPKRGWNVFCFDYGGFGQSSGKPTREVAITDTHSAIDYIKARDDIDGRRLILFGQSLGGAVAIVAAADRDDLAGLAAEGAFASYQEEARFVCHHTWWLWGVAGIASKTFISSGYDPIEMVGRLGRLAKLFICGRSDGIVDYRHTLALHEAAQQPKELWVLEDGSHTDALIDDEPDSQDPSKTRRDRFTQFLQRAASR